MFWLVVLFWETPLPCPQVHRPVKGRASLWAEASLYRPGVKRLLRWSSSVVGRGGIQTIFWLRPCGTGIEWLFFFQSHYAEVWPRPLLAECDPVSCYGATHSGRPKAFTPKASICLAHISIPLSNDRPSLTNNLRSDRNFLARPPNYSLYCILGWSDNTLFSRDLGWSDRTFPGPWPDSDFMGFPFSIGYNRKASLRMASFFPVLHSQYGCPVAWISVAFFI